MIRHLAGTEGAGDETAQQILSIPTGERQYGISVTDSNGLQDLRLGRVDDHRSGLAVDDDGRALLESEKVRSDFYRNVSHELSGRSHYRNDM
mgnify:CR=1 FL=1